MPKQTAIDLIQTYLNDGFVTYPDKVASGVQVNGLTFADLQTWTEISKKNLESLSKSGRLALIPEGNLTNIASYVENMRSNAAAMTPENPNLANMVENCLTWSEQIIAQTAPYMNLVDNTSYETLTGNVESLLSATKKQIETDEKAIKAQKRSIDSINTKSVSLLRGVSSGVLGKNFGELSNSNWNWLILSIAGIVTVIFGAEWLISSHSVAKYLTSALQQDDLDYKVFFAKWSATLPYLIITSVGAFELRARIRIRDTYLYRESVAGGLDGYTESLLTKVEDIQDKAEKSEARKIVIQFMIDAMIELTKSPNAGHEKSSVGIKVRDIAEAKFNTQR